MATTCPTCGEKVPKGFLHVPGELTNPLELPPCNKVSSQQVHDYLAAHCTNCGGLLEDGRIHHPVNDRSCAVVNEGAPVPSLVFDPDQPAWQAPVALPPIPTTPPLLGGDS